MFYSALCCFTFRLPPESGQASGLHGADSGSREGSVQSSEDPQRHTQVWSHLPCLVSGSDHCQKQGKGAFKELKRGLKLAARVLWLESKHGFLCCVQISRMLAAKAALAIRYDALGEDTNAEMGAENRAKLEARLRQLEEKGVSATGGHLIKRFHWPYLNWKTHSCWWGFIQRGIILILILVAPLQIRRISGTGKAMAKADKYQHKRWSVTFLKMRYFHLLLSQFLNTHVFSQQWSANVWSVWRFHYSLHLKKEENWGGGGGGGWRARNACGQIQKAQKGNGNRRWVNLKHRRRSRLYICTELHDAQGVLSPH